MVKKVKGALLYSILLITILGIFVKHPNGNPITVLPTKLIAIPSFEIFSKTFLKLKILDTLSLGLITIIFTFTFVDMFDTIGTVVGLATKLNIIQPDGSFPKAGRVLVCDAVGTIFGALCGTSTVTTYIESAAGISEGGKTGLTSVVVGILFLLSLFFWPIAICIPKEATAPALIIVGYLMIEPILRVNFSDITEGLPAFITLILMPLTYSIANGLIFGILSYVVIKILSGKAKQVSLTMLIISAVFLIYFLVK
jgi:AGZA family xanthine/uracil permease-like MFS transporter